MRKEIGRVCELSCDEAVIRELDPQGRLAYGDTLLNAIGLGGNYKDSLASLTLNESKELLEHTQRIGIIKQGLIPEQTLFLYTQIRKKLSDFNQANRQPPKVLRSISQKMMLKSS